MKLFNISQWRCWLMATMLTTSAMALNSCSSVPLTGRNRVMIVSDDVILQNSFQEYRQFIARAPKSSNQVAIAQVRRVGERIARATEAYLGRVGLGEDAKKYRWEFNLVASPQVNAFCMPGGKIVVYEGLFKYARTDDELATVLSHEVAHAVAKHGNERMSQSMLQQYGAIALGTILSGKSVAVQQAASTVYGLGSKMLVMLPYSRKHEYEADQIGLYLMAMAGYNPNSAITFWKKMAAGKTNATPEFMSTHPNDGNRVQRIQTELPKVEAFMHGGTTVAPKQKETPKPQREEGRKVPIQTHY